MYQSWADLIGQFRPKRKSCLTFDIVASTKKKKIVFRSGGWAVPLQAPSPRPLRATITEYISELLLIYSEGFTDRQADRQTDRQTSKGKC